MSVTYPLSTPTNKTVAEITLIARNVVGVSTSPFTFKQQTYQFSGQRWEADIKLPEQLVIAEMDSILQNFLAELEQNNIKLEDYFKITGLTEEALREDLNQQASRNLSMVLILDKVIEDFEIKLNENDNSLIDQHMESHDSDKDDVEKTTHRMNLEAESLRNKAMLHVLQNGVSIDKNGEKVYLQDVYNQESETGEEE